MRFERKFGVEVRREIFRLAARGLSQREIAARVFCSQMTVCRVLRPFGGVYRPRRVWEPSPARLSLDDRIEIKLGLERGESFTAIGRRLGRACSTISREVGHNGGRAGYRPMPAHEQADRQARRPKATKLASSPALCARVVNDLKAFWSPQQIANRLRADFPGDTTMRVSHETIYRSLYVQGRGELRRELARCLRTGRAARKPRGRGERRGQIPDKVMISELPPELGDRVPGRWEGDLILGKNNKSAIGTLVERSTRFVILLHLPNDHGAEEVRDAMTVAIQTLPSALVRSITWDQGMEMAQHREFTIDTGVQIYFCDPRSPWQRGTNENTNGLLRQYFPKGTDLSVHDTAALQAAADSLNSRPRMTLDWKTPAEKLADLIATTA